MTVTNEDRMQSSVHLTADGAAVSILDQRVLPNRRTDLELNTKESLYDAIRSLAVRGAPAIGIAAAYGMYVLAKRRCDGLGSGAEGASKAASAERAGMSGGAFPGDGAASSESLRNAFCAGLEEDGAYLVSARPTAVNLSWAVNRMLGVVSSHPSADVPALVSLLREEALRIHDEDIEMCTRIAEYGLSLVRPGDGILTHCNAGPLATSKYGTALGSILLGKERGIDFRVFADETRPLLQGARLTAYELSEAGVDVTLICDNMASLVMKNGWVNACFVGCDRIAANGDFANKIGTSGVAILARYYGIPFYTLGPASTVDMDCPTGAAIRIEERDPDEIRSMWYREPMAPADVKCYNPAFDVTDHSLLTAIVTDRGIVRPPFDVNLRKLFG